MASPALSNTRSWRLDGSCWEPCDALPLADRGFRYGMSVFETVAVASGRPLLLEAHLERLRRAAQDCGAEPLPLPAFDFSQLPTGLLRFYLTAGPGAATDPFAGGGYAIFDEAEVGWNLPALRVLACAAPYLPRPGGWKSGNYWPNVDALELARRADCHEALLFNPEGLLVGAAMANVFLRVRGEWLTPTRATGARDGAVRAWVLGQGFAREEFLDIGTVAECTEAFLTNSRIGIRAAGELDGRPLKVETSNLQQHYFHEVFSG